MNCVAKVWGLNRVMRSAAIDNERPKGDVQRSCNTTPETNRHNQADQQAEVPVTSRFRGNQHSQRGAEKGLPRVQLTRCQPNRGQSHPTHAGDGGGLSWGAIALKARTPLIVRRTAPAVVVSILSPLAWRVRADAAGILEG